MPAKHVQQPQACTRTGSNASCSPIHWPGQHLWGTTGRWALGSSRENRYPLCSSESEQHTQTQTTVQHSPDRDGEGRGAAGMHGLAFCPIPGGFLEEVTPEQSGADSSQQLRHQGLVQTGAQEALVVYGGDMGYPEESRRTNDTGRCNHTCQEQEDRGPSQPHEGQLATAREGRRGWGRGGPEVSASVLGLSSPAAPGSVLVAGAAGPWGQGGGGLLPTGGG